MTAFYVLGGVLAGWALVLTALGLMRHDFPGSRNGERIVSAISAVLVAAAIGSGVVTAASEDEEGEGHQAVAAQPQDERPDATGPGATNTRLELRADPTGALAFEQDALQSPPGQVTIAMENPASLPHNVALEGSGVDEEGEIVEQGGTSQVTARVEPGEYTFYCSVPGHRQGGMEGTLAVSQN